MEKRVLLEKVREILDGELDEEKLNQAAAFVVKDLGSANAWLIEENALPLCYKTIAEYYYLTDNFALSDAWYEKFEKTFKKIRGDVMSSSDKVTLLDKEVITIADLQETFKISYTLASKKMREIKSYRDSLNLSGKCHRTDYIAYVTRQLPSIDGLSRMEQYSREFKHAR